MKINLYLAIAAVAVTSAVSVPALAGDDKSMDTRAGKLIVAEDNSLVLNGQKLRDSDGFGFSLEKKYVIGDADVILAMNNSGGTACPVQYFFITVSSQNRKANLSPEFGTCSDLAKPSQQGSKVIVTMPKWSGKGNSKYVYENGAVTENGKAVR